MSVADATEQVAERNSRQRDGQITGHMNAQIYADTQNTATEELISERRLWMVVLVHAVEDWRHGTLRARREAQDSLFHNDQDFEMVCSGAGLDRNDFRTRLLHIGR
jgi:hypothetical protein